MPKAKGFYSDLRRNIQTELKIFKCPQLRVSKTQTRGEKNENAIKQQQQKKAL